MDWDSKGINTACPLFSKLIHNHNRPDIDNQHPPQGGASDPQQVVDGKTGCSQSALTMHISGKLTARQKQQRYPLAREAQINFRETKVNLNELLMLLRSSQEVD